MDLGPIVFGCAGMVDLYGTISSEIGVPAIDGVTAAVKSVESLVAPGPSTSERGDYASPPRRDIGVCSPA